MTADPNAPIPGFPISYATFNNASAFTTGGNALVSNGTLQLTAAAGGQSGYAIYDTPFSSADGISVQFTYTSDGYDPNQGALGPADGLSFFLLNATGLASAADVVPGGNGGGLGYSDWGTSGITNGFLGVGLDTYGNYANADGGTQTNEYGNSAVLALQPNEIGVRGEGNGTSGYSWLGGANYAPGVDGTRTVRIDLLPDGTNQELLSLYVSSNGGQSFQEIIANEVVQQTLPSDFYFGFAASTGGGNDIHAIDNVSVTLPTDLQVSTPVLTAPPHANDPAGTLLPGDTFSYTYTITNTGPNASSEITLNDALPANAADVQWSVQDDNHSASDPMTGTGAIALDDISLAANDTATVTVTGTIRSDATSGNLDHVVTVTPGAAYSFLTPSNGENAFSLGGNQPVGFVDVPATFNGADTGPLQPFAQASLFDNTGSSDTLTVAVNPALGTLSSPIQGASYDAATGTLTFTGTAAQAQSALNGIVFTPAGTSTPGQSVSVPLALTFSDGSGQASANTVLSYAAPQLTAGLADDTGPSASDGITSSDTLAGVSDPGAVITVRNGQTVLGSVTAGADGSWSITPALADGHYNLTVLATGLDGAETSASVPLTLDTAVPTLTSGTVTASGSGTLLNVGAVVTFTAMASQPLVVAPASLTGGSLPALTLSNGGTATLDLADSSPTRLVFKYTVAPGDDTSDLKVANFALNGATAVTDLAGTPLQLASATTLLNSAVNTTPYTIDTTAPAAPSALALDPGSGSNGQTSDATPTIDGSAEPGSTVTLTDGSVVLGTATADATTGAWRITSSALANGTVGLTATATDAAGNVSAASAPLDITVLSAVTVALADDTGQSASDGVTNDDALTGMAVAGSTVTLSEAGQLLGTTTADGSGNWSVSGSALGLADGAHTITVSGTDASGNPASAQASFTLLTASPTVSLGAATTVANTPTPTLSGTASDGATVALQLNGQALGTTTADATGAWSYQLASSLASGSYQVTAQATDIAGNVSAISAASNLIEIAAPSSGTSVADDTTVTLQQLLGTGSSLQFVAGTEAVQLADGILSVGPDTQQAYLARLYQGLLGRTEDAQGISYWNGQLDAGASNADIAQGFLNTGEGQTAVAGLSDQQFVDTLYQGLLGRMGSADETAYWTNDLANGGSRADVLAAIGDSPEARQALSSATSKVWVPDPTATLIEATYETAFGRTPELSGLQYWTAALKSGLSVSAFEQDVASLPEFQATHGSQGASDLVTSLYENGLGRAPGPTELASAVGALQSGSQTPGSLLAMVATSSEANAYIGSKLA